MADEYDLKPVEEPKKNAPAPQAAPAQTPPGFVPPVPVIEPPDPETDEAGHTAEEREDIETHKGMAILAYILFIIPLLAVPKSKFARYHANQGLIVFILGCGSVFVAVVLQAMIWLFRIFLIRMDLGFIGALLGCIVWLVSVFLIVFSMALAVMGIINAANGEFKPLPLFGRHTLIK